MVSGVLTGGIGNCMFIQAAVISYAKKWGMDYFIPTKVINPHHKENTSPHFFKNINYSDRELNLPIYREKGFTYEEIPYMKHLCLSGYWQSYLYFNDYREEIIKAFGFDDIQTQNGVCSLHYRSGDYKGLPTIHPVISEQYIIGSINHMISKGYKNFLVFSDEMPEIKKIIEGFNWYGDCTFQCSEGQSDIDDLRLMASCASNITANSSYSYWGAYLNPNPDKIVLYPCKWFGESMSHNTKDLCPQNWIAI